MDPISIVGLASAIAQLADASFKIINVLNTIKDGNRERQKLCNEITLLWMVLRDLETQFAPLNAEQNGSWMAPIDSLAEPNGVFDQLKTALDEVWEKITTSDSKRGRIKQTIRWPFDQSYVDRTIARIERLKSSISIVTSQANIALAHEFREKVFHVQQTVSDNQFKSILDWLSPLNCREKQENITATPGTGSWFFTNISFQSWMSAEHRWLWCYGIPGAGKTYLASNTVNELRRLHKSEDALVLIVFCSYDTADSQSVDNLVTSLLKQVVQYRKKLPDKLHHRYREHLSAGTRPKIGEVCEMLSEAIVSSSKTFIILDALDELTEDSKRTSILHILYNLGGRPKIMVTSRKIESIASRFGVHGVMCDGCSKESLEVYHHCEECADFDYCENCREDGEPHEHFFVKRYSSTKKVISASPEDIENYITRRIEVEEVLHGIVQQNRKLRDLVLDRIIKNAQDM